MSHSSASSSQRTACTACLQRWRHNSPLKSWLTINQLTWPNIQADLNFPKRPCETLKTFSFSYACLVWQLSKGNLYAAETWCLKAKTVAKLNSTEMDFWRRSAWIASVMHVIFAFEFDGNFEIFILWNSGRECRVATAIVSSYTSFNPVVTWPEHYTLKNAWLVSSAL